MTTRTATVYAFTDFGLRPVAAYVITKSDARPFEPKAGEDMDAMLARVRAWLARRRYGVEQHDLLVKDIDASDAGQRRSWVLAFLAAARLKKLEKFLNATCDRP